MVKEVWDEGEKNEPRGLSTVFPMGEPNDAYAQYFVGKSWLAPLGDPQLS